MSDNGMAAVHMVNSRVAADTAWEDDGMTAGPRVTPAEQERLCLDGIDLVTLYSLGEPANTLGASEEAVEAMALYAQLLEATLMTLYAAAHSPTTIDRVREAARETARAWRGRPTP